MANLAQQLDRLKLSRYLGNADPNFIAAFGTRLQAALNDPEMRARIEELGGPDLFAKIQGLIDVPLNPESIREGQERRTAPLLGSQALFSASKGAANLVESFGADEALLNLVAGEDLGEADIVPFGPTEGAAFTTELPLFGETDPIALGTQLASFLVPAGTAVGGARALIGATGLAAAHPALASTAAFALGGGTVEAARQTGRYLAKGEDYDPTAIAMEAAIFGAGGTPVGGGLIGSRLRAAGLSGIAATGVPLLLGRELDPERIASEVAFGAIFGNPKLADAPIGVTEAVKDLKVEDFGATPKAGETPLMQQLEPQPQSPAQLTQLLRARKQAIEKLSKLSDEQLERMAQDVNLTKDQAIMVRDTIVSKAGRVLNDVDAPVVGKKLPPKDVKVEQPPNVDQVISDLAAYDPGPKIFRAPIGDPQRMADMVTNLALKHVGMNPKQAKSIMQDNMTVNQRLQLMVAIEDVVEGMKRDFTSKGKKAPSEVSLQKAATKAIELTVHDDGRVTFNPTRRIADDRVILRQTIMDDFLVEQLRMKKQLDIEEGARAIDKKTGEPAPKSKLHQELEESLRLLEEQRSTLEASTQPLKPLNEHQARKAASEITKDMSQKELANWVPGEEFGDFQNTIHAWSKRQAAERKLAQLAQKREMDSFIRLTKGNNSVHFEIRKFGEFGAEGTPTFAKETTKKGLSYIDLKKEALDRGISVKLQEGDVPFRATFKGQDVGIRTLAQLRAFMDDVDALVNPKVKKAPKPKTVTPEVTPAKIRTGPSIDEVPQIRTEPGAEVIVPVKATKQVVEAAAHRKGMNVTHVGEGKYRVVNKLTGDVFATDSLKEAARIVGESDAPLAVEIGPVPPNSVVTSGGGGIGGPGSSGRMPLFDLPEGVKTSFPGPIRRTFGTRGETIKRMQDSTGLPIWDEVWEPSMRMSDVRDKFQKGFLQGTPQTKGLAKILKPVNPGRMRVVNDLLIAGNKVAQVVRDNKATKAEVKAATELRTWYQKLLKLDKKQLDEFFTQAIPEFRKVDGDVNRAVVDNTLHGSLLELVEDIYAGRVDLAEPHAGVLAQDILFAVGRNRLLKPAITQAEDFKRFLRSQINRKGILKEERTNIQTMLDFAERFTDSVVYGLRDGHHGAALVEPLNKFHAIMKKMGLSKGEEWTAADIERISAEASSYISGAALSVRPAPAFRNIWQRLLIGPKVGYDNVLAAQKEALTPEGIQLVEASGVIPGRITFLIEDVAAIMGGRRDQGALAAARRFVQEAQSQGLFLYRKADHGNRAVTFLAARRNFKNNAHLLREGKMDEFLIETGMALEGSTMINRILKPLQNVDARGWDAAVERSAREYGKRLVEDTQFIYNPANAPFWMQSIPGRFMGQFGVWPMAFTEYMLRNGLNKELVGGAFDALAKGPGALTPQQTAALRFVGRYAGIIAVLEALEELTGVDLSSYNRANPLDYQGGPAFEAFRDVVTLTTGTGGDFGDKLAWRNLQRFFSTFWLPFGGTFQDLAQAEEESDPVRAIMLALGFTLREEE